MTEKGNINIFSNKIILFQHNKLKVVVDNKLLQILKTNFS